MASCHYGIAWIGVLLLHWLDNNLEDLRGKQWREGRTVGGSRIYEV